MNVKRSMRILMTVAAGGMLLQFGGCVAAALAETFFLLGPLFL